MDTQVKFADFGVHSIFVEISNTCNMHCVFCPIDHVSRPKRRMDMATFTKVIDQIAALAPPEPISLNVLGEPLAHPDIFKFIDYCASKNVQLYLFTNGTLDADDIRQICQRDNIAALVLSYQTPDANTFQLRGTRMTFEKYQSRLLGAIEHVIAARAERKMRVEVHLANTKHLPFRDWAILETNEQALEAIRTLSDQIAALYRRHRADEIVEGQPIGDRFETVPTNILDTRDWEYWGYMAAPNIYIRIKYMGTFGALAAMLPKHITVKEQTTPVHCDMLKEALCVLSDGSITTCCLDVDAEMRMGNIATDTLVDALRSERRQRSIAHPEENAVCRRCAGEFVSSQTCGGAA